MRFHSKHNLKLIALFLLASFAISCRKDKDASEFDQNKINMVVADNFNLSAFNAALRRSTLDKELQQGVGPYTLLAPSDAAFTKAGYNGAVGVLAANATTIARIANYHTLDGKYELNKLPFLFNQELRSRGGKLYATHWVKGTDTVLTINGSKILSKNIPASNGLVQVIDRVLTPYLHDLIGDAIAAESSLTLFAQALKASGVLEKLNGKGSYTIFAPTNSAMQALGYQSIQQINQTDVAELKRLVDYHIVADRRFVYDYILSTGPTNTAKQSMIDGNSINVKLITEPNSTGGFTGISLRGIGNTADVNLSKRDILTGNGVLHIIDTGLRLTQ